MGKLQIESFIRNNISLDYILKWSYTSNKEHKEYILDRSNLEETLKNLMDTISNETFIYIEDDLECLRAILGINEVLKIELI